MAPTVRFIAISCMLSGLMTACGKKDEAADPARFDMEMTNSVADPAIREAIESPIATDPDLAAEANRDAVRPSDKPLNGAVPANLSPAQAKDKALQLAGGSFAKAPAATRSDISTGGPVTLGARAESLAGKWAGRLCGVIRPAYDMGWAQHMPAAFPIYPGGNVMEAAGANESGACAVRAATFLTLSSQEEAMDFYATMAKRAGYSVEHITQNGDDMLEGIKAGKAMGYAIRFRVQRGGALLVSIIANDGR